MVSYYSQGFSFKNGNLAQKIEQESDFSFTGYWQHHFESPGQSEEKKAWYLGLLEGKIVFSGYQLLSVSSLFETIERYVFRLRSYKAKQLSYSLKGKLISADQEQQVMLLPVLLKSLYESNLVSPKDVKQALRLKILKDFDEVLFEQEGRARFVPDENLTVQAPHFCFDLPNLLAEARRRKLIWDNVYQLIPSLDSTLTINEDALQRADLTAQQEKHLRAMVSHGETPSAIAQALAQDTLEIARGLAQLVDKGLLQVKRSSQSRQPEIMIIDDSPLMLRQFKMLVSSWGYQVRSHSDPATALESIRTAQPLVIFLDINMPGLSGFDLLKQIRRHPEIASIPLIMLTAERTLSNNWRAQWSGCQFLSKPLSTQEISRFKQELRQLLEEIMPVATTA